MSGIRHLATLIVCVAAVMFAFSVRAVVVTGASMEPTIVPGDVCFVIKQSEVRSGDIVVYRRKGEQAVVHRAVQVLKDDSLVTKGDANPVADRDVVVPAETVGRVVLVVPSGAALRGWMRATRGATLLNLSE